MNASKKQNVTDGNTALGIELGSTRIKAVLIGADCKPLASGSHNWENRLENGYWTYRLEDVWKGIQDAYSNLVLEVEQRYGVKLESIGSIGVSAMMHGYLVFDKEGKLLVPFRTWRNTTTEQAAAELTEQFAFNIPQRWSIAHLYQTILNKEEHLANIDYLTTLAGYVHWRLAGEKVMGVGEASGMFPISSTTKLYNEEMIQKFDRLAAEKGFNQPLLSILPKVLDAGDSAGVLTEEGAKLLDPSGNLKAGVPLCPPEGDAGTGMVATNSVAEKTGNVSAGTSIFAMAVLEHELSQVYTEIDMVTTPHGKPVAMVHCNNCCSDIDAWIGLFGQMIDALGREYSKNELYQALYNAAMKADSDCGGLVSFNYFSGEPVTGLDEGRPLLVRLPDSKMSLANFARNLIFSAISTLKIGMDILTGQEHVRLEQMLGHGGLFKVEGVGQSLMAAALDVPVTVMESAGEGGPWGMALLARFMVDRMAGESLEEYLNRRAFNGIESKTAAPQAELSESFSIYIERYKSMLPVEFSAVKKLKK